MRIALFLPNWVGDAVMATPAIRAVRQSYPIAHMIAIGRPHIADVLEGSGWLEEFIPLQPSGPPAQRMLAVASRVRRQKPDLALLFPNSFRSALVAWLAGCPRRVGYARYGRSLLLTDRLEPLRDRRGRLRPAPILPAYNRIAEHAGCTVRSGRMELFTTPRDEALADDVWQEFALYRHGEVVCLNPGAAFGAAKLWPAQYFVRLARDLAERRGAGVLVLCGPAERELARRIADLADHPSVHSLADARVCIGLTKACIRRADLLVSTDSGPRHFAAAFDRPVVALFGPTHIAWTDTFFANEMQLQKSVPCGPCQQRTCHLDHRCMTSLTPEEVFAAAITLLQCAKAAPAARERYAS
jgi:heptosyltransferase-2